VKRWTVVPHAGRCCGGCSATLAADTPVQVVVLPGVRGLGRERYRCENCAGEPVNLEEVDLERARLLMERERAAMQRPIEEPHPPPVTRYRLPKPVQPHASMAVQTATRPDPRRLAANDRD
jgi:hypothetical protein